MKIINCAKLVIENIKLNKKNKKLKKLYKESEQNFNVMFEENRVLKSRLRKIKRENVELKKEIKK